MLHNFIFSEKKDLLTREIALGNVPEEAIAFSKDTGEIWTHGTWFAGLPEDVVRTAELLSVQNSLEEKDLELENSLTQLIDPLSEEEINELFN